MRPKNKLWLPAGERANRCVLGGLLVLLAFLVRGMAVQGSLNESMLAATRDFDTPRFQTAGEYARITIANCDTLQQVGAPLLPFQTVRLLLPPGGKVAKVEAHLPQGERMLPGTWQVDYGRLPVTSPSLGKAQLSNKATDRPDPAIYESDQPYPPVRAELASVQMLAGHAVAVVRVYPVQYFALRSEVVFAPQVTVRVTVEGGSQLSAVAPPPCRALDLAKESLAGAVDNPEMLGNYDNLPGANLKSGSIYDYLLITRSNLVSAFQPLVTLKTEAGLAVRVETVETITNAYTGRDVPEKLRNYIRYAFTNWGISYVLLGGDVEVVPCRYAYVNMGSLVSNPTVPADLYYGCLDGSWNNDGDANWGEANDGAGSGDVDLLAEVYVGRAPVATAGEVSVFVEKANRYMTQSHPNLTNALFLAESLGETSTGMAQGGDMFEPLVPLFAGYQVSWLDDRFTVPEWTKMDALNAMNQSPHVVVLNGHGDDYTLIGVQRPFVRSIETPDIGLLTNQWPFLAYSVGCNVGQFDNDRFSPDAIGEELVKQHNRGAFAAVFNSRLGWYDEQDEARYSGEFQARFFAQLLANGKTNFGVANQLGKQDLVSRLESNGIMTYRWCYYEITLFGDPHLACQKPAVTSQGTPHWWLASFGWTNQFETAAAADTDHDGMAAWQEYIAGTNPVDAMSALRIAPLSFSGPSPRLEWPSAAGRRYSIWAASEPLTSSFVLVTNHLAATPPKNTLILDQSPGARRFFRVGVELVP